MSIYQANPNILTKFIKHELVNGVVFYTIEVYYQQSDAEGNKSKRIWQKRSRYSQLLQIHQRCKEIYRESLPEFPPKKWFGNTDSGFVEMRQTQLQVYLSTVLKFTKLEELPPLRNFLFEGIDLKPPVENRHSAPVKKAELEPPGDNNQNLLQQSSLGSNANNTKKGDVLADLKEKFVEVGKLCVPEDDERDRKREIYSKKLKQKFSSGIIERLTLPKGTEKNLISLHETSLRIKEEDLINHLEESIIRISNRIERDHDFLFKIGFVHINQV